MQKLELSSLDPVLASKIQGIIEQGNARSDAADYDASRPCYLEAWDMLPGKKTNWDFAQWIAMSLFQDCMATKNFDDAKKWALISYEARPSEIGFASLIDLGWVALETNELDEAFDWFSRAYEIAGRFAFTDYPAHLYKFYAERKKKYA